MTNEEIDSVAREVVDGALTALTNYGLDLQKVSKEAKDVLTARVRSGMYRVAFQTFNNATEASVSAIGSLKNSIQDR